MAASRVRQLARDATHGIGRASGGADWRVGKLRHVALGAWARFDRGSATEDRAMAAQPTDLDRESRRVAAAAQSLAADAIDGHGIAAFFGANEREIAALMAETVLAWRDYLDEISEIPPSASVGD